LNIVDCMDYACKFLANCCSKINILQTDCFELKTNHK